MILIYQAIVWVLKIIQYAIFARVIISWLPISRDNQFIRLLYQITEPILAPVRNIIQKSSFGKNMMIDFSPIIAFFLIGFVQYLAAALLLGA